MRAFASKLVALVEFVALGVALVVTSIVTTARPLDEATGWERDD